jgi:hypothetical protein
VRWLALLLLCNCGLLFDGAYLLSDKHTTKTEEQRRPTGERETQPELSLGYDGPRLRVACEEVTHSVDRVWNVDKVYEYQGGFYQAHLVPVIIEGAVGAGLGIGLGIKCADPSSNLPCSTLYGTIPLGVDFAYSLIRLLTIDPPKLVDKRTTAAYVEKRGTVLQRTSVACPADAVVMAGQAREGVDPAGYLTAPAQQRIEAAMLDVYAMAAAATRDQRSRDLNRCDFFAMKPGGFVPSGCVR